MPAEIGPSFPNALKTPETPNSKRFAFVIPGASSSTPGMSFLQEGFKKRYGQDNAHVYNSALFNFEPVAADRYTGMKKELEGRLHAGDSVDVFLLSLGAGESFQVLDAIESLGEYKDKLHFYYISPTAPKTFPEAAKYIAKYSRVATQEATTIGPGKGRILRGIMSFATVPPEDFTENRELYTTGIRNIAKRFSQAGEVAATDEIPFSTDPDVNFLANETIFDQHEREAINTLDNALKSAVTDGDSRQVRRLLMRRARLTNPKMGKIYNGSYAEDMGFERLDKPEVKSTREGRKAKRKLLADTFWRAEVNDKLDGMAESGFDMTVVVPEYDTLFSVAEAKQLAQDRPNVHVKLAALTTHGFPWGVIPGATADIAAQPPQAA